MSNYKHKFLKVVINNRWEKTSIDRPDSWVYFGFGIKYFSVTEYEYYISLFGVDFRFFFIRNLK